MIVTLLGTGTSQGVPVIACDCPVCTSLDFKDKRLRTSIYFKTDKLKCIVDTGPDFKTQVLRENIRELDAIIFTHEHKDHTAGLDDVRGFNFAQNADMPVYGRKQVLRQLKKEFAYAFADKKYPGVPRLDLKSISGQPFEINGQEIIPIDVMHGKLPVYGFRVNDFAYVTDANFIEDSELEKLKNLDVLILDALQKSKHMSHFTLSESVELIRYLNPGKAFLTHLSHKMGKHKEVEKDLPDNVFLAYDGLKLQI